MMSDLSKTASSNDQGFDLGGQAASQSSEVGDIKQLITRLTDQFESSDARTAIMLEAIQGQLAALSAQSRAARTRVPDHLTGAFDRIDDAIAGLADKLADQQAASQADAATDVRRAEAVFAAFAEADANDASVLRKTIDDTPKAIHEPAAAPDPIAFAATSGSKAGNPEEPWDSESAEALTRIYESGPAELAPGLAAPVVEAAPAAVVAPILETPESAVGDSAVRLDQPWLEDRFASIADQVAQTLTTSDAEFSFSEISSRLDELEGRFQQALKDVSVKHDPEALASIEGYINDLAEQIEQSRAEFSRVGAIEQEIVALADRLSDERIASFAAPQPAQMPEIDFASIADLVTERLAIQNAAADTSGDVAAETNELKMLVGSFIESQRDADDQTNAMLDTVQKALIRVLDRIDSLETAQLTIADKIDRVGSAPMPVASMPPVAAPAARPAMQQPPAIRSAMPDDDFQDEFTNARPQPRPGTAPLAAPLSERAADPELTGDGRRQNFIESARRAAQAAASRPTLGAPLAAASVDPRVRPSEELDHDVPDDDDMGAPEEKAVAGGSSRSRLWFATFVLAVLAVGAGAYVVKTGGIGEDSSVARQLITPETLERERAAKTGQAGKSETVRQGTSNDVSPADRESRGPTVGTQVASATSNDSVPLGISIQHTDRELTPAEMAQAEARQRQAEASSRLGSELQSNGAVPAALIPGGPTAHSGAIGSSSGTAERGSAMMPPAEIGPSSLRSSAANGNASAQFEVGARFAEGRGVDQDFKQAASWYEKSAKQGFALAQYRLATLYERGLGIAKDHNLAKYWYMKSANQGTIKAMHNLAVLTAGQGNGAKPDYTTAAAWFNRAAERGLADSQFNLAILYQNGLGVPKDMKESYKWFSLASRAGDAEAKAQEKAIADQLNAADKTTVDQAVSQWRAKSYDLATNDPTKAGNLWQTATSAS